MVERVVLFVVDGMRPDGILKARTPVLQSLITHGASSLTAQTVMPSITLPTHASMFHGVSPEIHGVTSNLWQTVPPAESGEPVLGIMELVHQAELKAAAFYTWEELRDLWRPGSLVLSSFVNIYAPGGDHSDAEIARLAGETIVREQPDFAFVYLGWTDEIGHRKGWMSPEYLEAIGSADAAIGQVLEALEKAGLLESTTCLVTADHGGHEYGHGSDCPEDMTIPWILAGSGVRRGYSLTGPVRIVDTAATIAHLLGLSIPSIWQGRPVLEALE